MPTPSPESAAVQLNIELGGDFLLALLALQGVAGWNRWVQAMAAGYMPLGWGEHEEPPPIWFWLDFEGVDLSERHLDGIDLGLPSCKGARFDSSSLVGGRIGCCEDASFRGCDLRDCEFMGDISGADFTGARLDGVKLNGTPFDPSRPPIGLLPELLAVCDPQPECEPPGHGLPEHVVEVKGCLTELPMPE